MKAANIKRPISQLRVHIIPVGFEYDRIIFPAQSMKAEKIHLLTHNAGDDAKPFLENVQKTLQNSGFVLGDTLFIYETDIFNLHRSLKVLAFIFRGELTKNNSIYYNVSTGSKILSIAGMFACMLFGGTPYYCIPEMYTSLQKEKSEKTQITTGMKDWFEVQKFDMKRPPEKLIKFLFKMEEWMAQAHQTRIAKIDCLPFLQELEETIELPSGENADETHGPGSRTGEYNKLNSLYLTKLRKWKYIQIEAKPRGKIKITEEGQNALQIYGIFYGLKNLDD